MNSLIPVPRRILAVMGLLFNGLAHAMNCHVVSSPQFTFGHYDPLSPVALDVQAILQMQCTPAVPGEVLNLQLSLAGASGSLQLQHTPTGESLKFSLYADAARTRPIDSQQMLVMRFPLVTSTLLSLPVYARIPPRQSVSVGSYRLNLGILLNY